MCGFLGIEKDINLSIDVLISTSAMPRIITPENSFIAWNGENYPFEAWNADQTLQSAMNSSVNWYFQTVDEQLGASDVYRYIQEIGYGNENMSGDFSTYWMESSLEISPIEQVELLTKLQNNSFDFAPENIMMLYHYSWHFFLI